MARSLTGVLPLIESAVIAASNFAHVLSNELFPEICPKLNAERTGRHGAQICAGTAILDNRLRAPRRLAAFHHFLEHLSVPQSIHGPPKTLVLVGHQVSGLDQPIEWLKHQLLTVSDIFENLLAKDKIAAIDPNIRLVA
jgi:hypothetical protein